MALLLKVDCKITSSMLNFIEHPVVFRIYIA